LMTCSAFPITHRRARKALTPVLGQRRGHPGRFLLPVGVFHLPSHQPQERHTLRGVQRDGDPTDPRWQVFQPLERELSTSRRGPPYPAAIRVSAYRHAVGRVAPCPTASLIVATAAHPTSLGGQATSTAPRGRDPGTAPHLQARALTASPLSHSLDCDERGGPGHFQRAQPPRVGLSF